MLCMPKYWLFFSNVFFGKYQDKVCPIVWLRQKHLIPKNTSFSDQITWWLIAFLKKKNAIAKIKNDLR